MLLLLYHPSIVTKPPLETQDVSGLAIGGPTPLGVKGLRMGKDLVPTLWLATSSKKGWISSVQRRKPLSAANNSCLYRKLTWPAASRQSSR